jgi:hypothetical protein
MRLLSIIVFTVVLISNTFGQTTPTTQVKTMADLVALRIPTINNRLSALVTGRVTENDGGGGLFFYDGSDATSTNLGTVFKPAASDGRWLRQYSGPLNVKWFGAVGDGVADDSPEIQAALTLASTAPISKTVFIPQGTYLCNTGLTLTVGGIRITGESSFTDASAGGSVLLAGGAITLLTVGQTGPNIYVDLAEISNLILDGNSDTGVDGLRTVNTHRSVFSNLYIKDFSDNGIQIEDEQYSSHFKDIFVTGCNDGVNADVLNAQASQKIVFTNLQSESNTDDGVQLRAAELFDFFGGAIQANDVGMRIEDSSNVNIFGVQFEQNVSNEIEITKPTPSTGAGLNGGIIAGCWFYGSNAAGPNAIKSNGSGSLNIYGNFYQRHPSGTYDFDNTGDSGTLNSGNFIYPGNRNSDAVLYEARDGLFESYPITSVSTSATLRFNGTSWTNSAVLLNPGDGFIGINKTPTGFIDFTGIAPDESTTPTNGPSGFIVGAVGGKSSASGGTGGTGGNVTITAGIGGDKTNGGGAVVTGGTGGDTTISGGAGGSSSGGGTSNYGGYGGNLFLNGGAGTFSSADFGGQGGYVQILAGAAGAAGNRASGSVYVSGGASNGTGGAEGDVFLNRNQAGSIIGTTQFSADLVGVTAGKGIKIKEGSNARMGTATLVGGTIAVSNTSVTASTRVFISRSTTGGTEGTLSTTQINATSFTVNSSSGTDTSTVNWLLIEPSP